MSGRWAGSDRREELPADWRTRRNSVIKRDKGRCQWRDAPGAPICGARFRDVDHIIRGSDHRIENLQCLCAEHHAAKSSREGNEAKIPQRRPPERHPALG